MSASLEIPPAEMAKLRRTFQELRQVSGKKTDAQLCNDKAQDLSFKAMAQTEHVNPQQIAHEMGQTAVAVSISKKTGKFAARRRIFKENSFAAAIINSRLKKAGEPLLFGKALEKAVSRMVAARMRSTKFIKSGFLAAANKLRGFAKGSRISDPGVRVVGVPKGYAIPARESLHPVAEIINTATKDSPQAAVVAQTGLIKAVPIAIADWQVYIERKKQEAVNKVIGK